MKPILLKRGEKVICTTPYFQNFTHFKWYTLLHDFDSKQTKLLTLQNDLGFNSSPAIVGSQDFRYFLTESEWREVQLKKIF